MLRGVPASCLRLQPWPLPETARDPACTQSQLLCTQGLSSSDPRPRGDQGSASPGSWLPPLLQPSPQLQDCPEPLVLYRTGAECCSRLP